MVNPPSPMAVFLAAGTAFGLAIGVMASGASEPTNLLENGAFRHIDSRTGVPKGWSAYGRRDEKLRIRIVHLGRSEGRALLLDDRDDGAEIGLSQTVPAKAGEAYEASVEVRGYRDASPFGAYLQLRFLPSNKLYQTDLDPGGAKGFQRVAVAGRAPVGTTAAVVYLYTHRGPTPQVLLRDARLISGADLPSAPPEPIPPVYKKLKKLYRRTPIVRDGKPAVTIVAPPVQAYQELAERVAGAIATIAGISPPIVGDDAPEAAVPIKGPLIVLGNRSTNRTISGLYDRYYTLLDLRYPGPEGYVVRTCHNPFGDGHNVVLLGASDLPGVRRAVGRFIELLNQAGGRRGSLSIGRLAEIELGKGVAVPKNLHDFKTWEASAGYGSSGYFGWNSLSKRMAMYYMTGEEFHAREFLRLALPDEKTKKQIARTDGEMIENKDDPLAGPYHYNAHMMILYWDLIEESPVFTDEQRLAVTNAFARQLDHRKGEGIYGRTNPPACVGSRHAQWSAISLYCLGRYFQKDYPDPIWRHCVEAGKLHFKPLHRYAWVAGEGDNLYWYSTGIAPIFTYLALTGDRVPLQRGVMATLLRGQEMLFSGRPGHWALKYASIGYLHKAAYLTGDGRYIHYRRTTGVDTKVFRLGQSYWPGPELAAQPPDDLAGKWSINRLPLPQWQARGSGLRRDESFLFGSYRSTADGSGDFILLDGFNGASRNPYHAFAVLELRIGGDTLLAGYRNQLLTRVDGLIEDKIAMDAALKYQDVVGATAVAVGEVPDAAYCNWRRTVAQRVGRYALIVDDLTMRADSDNLEVESLWETASAPGIEGPGRITFPIDRRASAGRAWIGALKQKVTSNLKNAGAVKRLVGLKIVLLRARKPGGWLEMVFELDQRFEGELHARLLDYRDRGIVRFRLDGRPVGQRYDHYRPEVRKAEVPLGTHRLKSGRHRLRVEVVGKNPASGRYYVGLAGLAITGKGAPAPPKGVVVMCDAVSGRRRGRVATMRWTGPATRGGHRRFFSLVGVEAGGDAKTLACVRLADNAAALALPAPGLAAVGEFAGIEADLAVLATDHLFARRAVRVSASTAGGVLIEADHPVDVDWDFAAGRLHIINDQAVRIRVAGADGGEWLKLGAGRHEMKDVRPEATLLRQTNEYLASLLDRGRKEGDTTPGGRKPRPRPTLPALRTMMSAEVGGPVVDMIVAAEMKWICAAEGKTVHVLSAEGRPVRTLAADGPIRVLRWWKERRLLLVGCVDEKVIAFDTDGTRKWTFVSQMDPAVFRAAKTYWFKSAPGHEGIHGLYTGVFLNGKSQAFVGSACTLEILDEHGMLIKRLPQFWGKVSHFAIIDGPGGSLNLLAARKYNGTNRVGIINNKTLDPRPRGFDTVPPGCTYVPGWSSMNRYHLFYEDLDGDGTKEVISEINGTWNRVTVWRADGTALYDVSFGPGERIMARNMRDLDVADLDGDGTKEILAATSSGLIVCLDHRCKKRWAARLPSPPTIMQALVAKGAAWIVVGCEDGTVTVLDSRGRPIRSAAVNGRPTRVAALNTPRGPMVVLATSRGRVRGFQAAP